MRQRVDPQTGEVLFTMEQVRDIVRRAVDEKERSLREQYDRVLQQKLQGAHAPGRNTQRRNTQCVPGFAPPDQRGWAVPRAFAEQYQAFAKFNEDYISRSLKGNDLAYVS